ncbi:2-polyprenyl-3-methyl-5-hydroxy-6-metoxy-1,4-benzoquinol methylase [Tenacibaculum sp. MAR_2009_124]|nr:2-polyprenyl-3-methyl-5-hydroxy-6-metoxy-1,4-benzoquinol methylase [Tenacibaculum sp. MAR_2009_124]
MLTLLTMDTKQDWFSSWFNTPYYHILYKHRNDSDAQFFIRNITALLNLKENSFVADVPCGKGRHAVYLNSLGLNVRGGDLSENSIEYAKKFENETLKFEVWDMRKPIENKYDVIFNLFTSFGYFEDDSDDILVLNNFKKGLKKEGKLVLDFLNVEKVKNTLIPYEEKVIDGITFKINKQIKNGYILKNIDFEADNENHSYTEQVKVLSLEKMHHYFETAGLKIKHIFGDYSLNPFDKSNSDRLILIAE